MGCGVAVVGFDGIGWSGLLELTVTVVVVRDSASMGWTAVWALCAGSAVTWACRGVLDSPRFPAPGLGRAME